MTSHAILMTSYMMSSIPGKFKMADEREIVKLYYEYKCPAIVNKIVQKRYPGMKPLSRLQFHRLKNKFETYGTVYDRRKEGKGGPKTARSDENIQSIKTII